MKRIIISVVTFLLVFLGCAQQVANLKSKCCEQCNYAANQDTRAFDISGQACNDEHYLNMNLFKEDVYQSPAPILSQDCIKYFNNNPTTVSGCW